MKGNQVWISGNPSTESDYIAYLECIFHILKYRDYKDRVSVNVMLRRWCYHLNLPMVIIHKETFLNMFLNLLVKKEKIPFKHKMTFLTNKCLNTNTF